MSKIKLCGLTRERDIDTANLLKPDYIGFVFAKKSMRYVSKERARELKERLSTEILAVGVFVREEIPFVKELVEEQIIDVVQLHGGESEDYVATLRKEVACPIWQAYRVDTAEDIARANSSTADLILLDAGDGGTGGVFDWSLLGKVTRPYVLAGGLGPDNVEEAIQCYKPYGVDVSTNIETDGVKDPDKMTAFVAAAKNQKGKQL